MAVPYQREIRRAAATVRAPDGRRVPARLLAALVETESNFDPNAVSSVGARGLTQFMPGTARSYGVQFGSSLRAVRSQLEGAVKFLLGHGYGKAGRTKFSIGAYNGGAGNPQYGFAETVLSRAGKYRGLDGGVAGSQAGSGAQPGGSTRVNVSATATATEPVEMVQPGGLGTTGQLAAELDAGRQQRLARAVPAQLPDPAFTARKSLALAGGRTPVLATGGVSERPSVLGEVLATSELGGGPVQLTRTATARREGNVEVPTAGQPEQRSGGRGGGRVNPGPGYAGAEGIANAAARLYVEQFGGRRGDIGRKRTPSQNAAVGGDPNSDHLTTNTSTYAVDLTATGDRIHQMGRAVARLYGVTYTPNSYSSGGTYRAPNGRTYRVQILGGGGIDHDDHLHVGVRAA